MYTTFAVAALLAATALARGRNDGSSRWNSIDTVILADVAGQTGTSMELDYYYDNDEFHADFMLKFPTTGLEAKLIFGFCFFEKRDGSNFQSPMLVDCNEMTYTIDPAAITAAAASQLDKTALGDFSLQDLNLESIADDLKFEERVQDKAKYPKKDASAAITNDASKNWRLSANKSNAVNCKAVANSAPPTFTCDSLQVHFFRKFVTSETAEDNQITKDQLWSTTGFVTQQAAGTSDKDRVWGAKNFAKTTAKADVDFFKAKAASTGRTAEQKEADDKDSKGRDLRTGAAIPEPAKPDDDADKPADDADKADDKPAGGDVADELTEEEKKAAADKLAKEEADKEEDSAVAVATYAAAMATAFGALFI